MPLNEHIYMHGIQGKEQLGHLESNLYASSRYFFGPDHLLVLPSFVLLISSEDLLDPYLNRSVLLRETGSQTFRQTESQTDRYYSV